MTNKSLLSRSLNIKVGLADIVSLLILSWIISEAGYWVLRYLYRLWFRALSFPEALIQPADNYGYLQIASYYLHGEIYLPIEDVVGSIGPPLNAYWCIGIMNLFNIEPTPFHVRLILQITFWFGTAVLLIGTLVFSHVRFNNISRFASVAMVVSFFILGFIFLPMTSFNSVHYIHFLFLLLTLSLCISTYLNYRCDIWGRPDYLWAIVPVLTCAILFTCPPYVLSSFVFVPAFIAKLKISSNRTRLGASLIIGMIVSVTLVGILHFNEPYMFKWIVDIALMQVPHEEFLLNLLRLLKLNWRNEAITLLAIFALYRMDSKINKNWHFTLFLLSIFLSCFVPAIKLGGGTYNFAIVWFYALFIGGVYSFIGLIIQRRAINVLILVILLTVGLSVGTPIIRQGPRIFVEKDWSQIAAVNRVLDYAKLKDMRYYVDSHPAYFVSRSLPLKYEAANIWDLKASGLGSSSLFAITQNANNLKWDLIILHLSPPDIDFAKRFIGSDFVTTVERRYIRIAELPSSEISNQGLVDAKLNTTAVIFLSPRYLSEKEEILQIIAQNKH